MPDLSLSKTCFMHSRLTLLFFVFAAVTSAQAPPDAIAPEDSAFNTFVSRRKLPVIYGKISHADAADIKKLSITYSIVTPLADLQSKRVAAIQQDGSFVLKLDNALAYQQVWLSVGELFYAGLYVNTDLQVQLDMKQIKAAKEVNFNGPGVEYKGSDGPLTAYMNNYILHRRPEQLRISEQLNELSMHREMPDDSFFVRYNQLFDSLKLIQESYTKVHASPFAWLLENERMSEYYGNICTRYWGKKMDNILWQKVADHKAYAISNSGSLFCRYLATYVSLMPGSRQRATWKDVAQLANLTEHEQSIIDSLKKYTSTKPAADPQSKDIQLWTEQLRSRLQQLNMLQGLARSVQRIDSLFHPAKADYLKLRLNDSHDLPEQQLAVDFLLPGIHTPWCAALLQSERRAITAKVRVVNNYLANGKRSSEKYAGFAKPFISTSFGATLYKVKGMRGPDFIASLQQRFAGKALIIDLWATWCAPCLSEMPHSKSLQLATKDLPVVFVYLCTLRSSSEQKWSSKVMEMQQPGFHFLIDEKLDAELAGYFSFSGYPGYALVDKKGVYRPGAIKWLKEITDRNALARLINQ